MGGKKGNKSDYSKNPFEGSSKQLNTGSANSSKNFNNSSKNVLSPITNSSKQSLGFGNHILVAGVIIALFFLVSLIAYFSFKKRQVQYNPNAGDPFENAAQYAMFM